MSLKSAEWWVSQSVLHKMSYCVVFPIPLGMFCCVWSMDLCSGSHCYISNLESCLQGERFWARLSGARNGVRGSVADIHVNISVWGETFSMLAGKQSSLNYDNIVPHTMIIKLNGKESLITFIELQFSKTMT